MAVSQDARITEPLPVAGPSGAPLPGSSDEVSPAQFRGALSHVATAVSIVSTAGPAGMAGVTCSAVAALSDDPPLLIACIHRKSAANAAIKANRVLCVNVLSAAQKDLSLLFAGVGGMPMPERFLKASWGMLATGAPHCLDALLAIDCEVLDVRDIGTHSLFIAKPVATAQADAAEPLAYFRRTFGSIHPI